MNLDEIFFLPFKIQLDITNSCNLACKYCYNDSKKEMTGKLSNKEILNFLDYLKKLRIHSVLFSGGEPLLNKNLFDYAKKLRASSVKVYLNTNSTLINKKNAEQIVANFDGILTNIDGEKKTHDFLRGKKGAFLLTLKAIKELKKLGYAKKIKIVTVLTKKNLGEMEKTISFVKKLDVGEHRFLAFFPNGRGKKHSDLVLKGNDWKRVFKVLRKNPSVVLGHGGILLFNKVDSDIATACNAGKYYVVVASNGNVYPCNVGRDKQNLAGNIKKEELKKIWQSSKIISYYRNFKVNHPLCNGCFKKVSCNGGCRTWANKFSGGNGIDPRCLWGDCFESGITKNGN